MLSKLSGLSLPITSKLNPLSQANWLYMAKSAVLTRLAIALMRTWQNLPNKNNNPQASPLEKHQSLWERFFIEILGTTGYMLAMHLGQDALAKVLESHPTLDPSRIGDGIVGLSHPESQLLKDTIHQFFGEKSKGLISRTLYGKANLANVFKALETSPMGASLMNNDQVRVSLEKFITQLNWRASATLLAGIGAGVMFGGVIVQFVNDRIFGPVVEPFLARMFGLDDGKGGSHKVPAQPLTDPMLPKGWVAFDHQSQAYPPNSTPPHLSPLHKTASAINPAPTFPKTGKSPFITHLSTIQRTFVC